MGLLDIRTVMISYVISNGICALVMYLLWLRSRGRFSGVGLWLADYLMQFAAVLLIVLRGTLPEIVAVFLGNGLVVGGTILLLIGLERFLGKRGPQAQNVLLLAAFLAAQLFFYYIRPDLTARNINLSLALLAVCGQCAWLTVRRAGPEWRAMARNTGAVFALYALISLLRIIADLAVPSGDDFFRSSVYDALVLMSYQMLFVALTFTLLLLVSRRLMSDLEKDFAARRLVEEALRVSREKLAKAFHASPDAILITRLRDGRLLEANDGFSRLMGFSREEASAGTTLQLSIWVNPGDRDQFVSALKADGRVNNLEYNLRTKSGKILRCLYSAETIDLEGEPHVLSIVRDISQWNRAQEILKLRLDLWEFSAGHTIDELMQKALDEIEILTGNSISFYHFVMEDGNTLLLQAWSTRTRREFCRADAKGQHYGLDRAGMWADAIRMRKPVIHNEYASLPGRRGLPEGHAAVRRELVVPTFHAGRIVAVLGVGNRPTPYDDRDADFLSSVADIIWTIVEHKRTEEEIHELQKKMSEMAVRDSLTGLYNRHYLEETLSRELARAAREKYPVSFIMIDIDHFKRINDTYGHEAGDSILRELAAMLLKNSRASDILYRYGGEEFLAILPKTRAESAFHVAEKWRRGVAESAFLPGSGGGKVTISCGVSAFPDQGTAGTGLIADADQALYQAKNTGRNRSVLWNNPQEPGAAG
jgi:diguanylate cyclase (GGDEF)-like protein/PAS domain S-box-containing protein